MFYKVIDVRDSDHPVAEALDRVSTHFSSWDAYQALYGPHTRSGNVSVVQREGWLWIEEWTWLEWQPEEVEIRYIGAFGAAAPVIRQGIVAPAGWVEA